MGLIIKPVKEIDQYMKILVYGDPGVGKTTLISTAEEHPKLRRTLVANVEGGMLSISGTDVHATEQIKKVSELEDLYWSIAGKEEKFKQYQTLAVDSGTELQTLDLEQTVAETIKKKNQKDRDRDEIYLEDYGKSTARLKRIFRYLRDLPMNVIITALVRRVMPPGNPSNNVKRDPIAVLPQFTEKLSSSLMGYMDCVWYMYTDEKEDAQGNLTLERYLLTQPHGPYKVKTRGANFSRQIGQVVTNPNLAKLYKILLETEIHEKK